MREVALSSGNVPGDVDVLVVVAPQAITDTERFAIDQYLMRGGAVVAVAGNYTLTPDPFGGGLAVQEVWDGLQELLSSYGITVESSLVLDPQNEPFPVPVTRDVGGFQVQEIHSMDYPFFVDVRPDGMASDHPIVANLPAVTLNWASPITIDEAKNARRQVTTLLQSSEASWTQSDANIQPNFELFPNLGFASTDETKSYPLAVSVQGAFESYFKDKPSPLSESATGEAEAGAGPETPAAPVAGTIEVSPETARLVVIGSAAFLDDIVFEISSSLTPERYLNSLKLMQNAVAWATEDLDLLSIRARGITARILRPLTERTQSLWEGANYVVAMLALAAIGIMWNVHRKSEQPMELLPPGTVPTSAKEAE